MKEKIKEKLNARLELILNKDAENISSDEFTILNSELSKIEFEESKEEKNKEFAEMMAKILK